MKVFSLVALLMRVLLSPTPVEGGLNRGNCVAYGRGTFGRGSFGVLRGVQKLRGHSFADRGRGGRSVGERGSQPAQT